MKPHHRFALALTGALLISSLPAGAASLSERYEALRTEQPKLALRDAAAKLNVSEAELLAANGIGKTVTRLQEGENVPREIMRRALDLGKVMALTRNENGVLERTGVATRLKPQEEITGLDADKEKEREARMRNIAGGYLGGEIDLRFTFKNWKYAFAVVQPGKDGVVSRSLQFFDAQGNAAHKVYVKSDAGVAVFDKIVADFRNPSQSAELNVAAAPVKKRRSRTAVDVKEFQLAWNEINDVHQFNRLLSEFGVTREQGCVWARWTKSSASRRKPCASCWKRRPSSRWTSWPSWAMTRPSRSTAARSTKCRKRAATSTCWIPSSTCTCATAPGQRLHRQARRRGERRVLRQGRQRSGELLRRAQPRETSAASLDRPDRGPAKLGTANQAAAKANGKRNNHSAPSGNDGQARRRGPGLGRR
jgi:putative heme degradation protein